MNFLLHIGEPLFHCIQEHRFVDVRGSYDYRVTFSERAIEVLNKILMIGKILSLRVNSSSDLVDGILRGNLNIYQLI